MHSNKTRFQTLESLYSNEAPNCKFFKSKHAYKTQNDSNFITAPQINVNMNNGCCLNVSETPIFVMNCYKYLKNSL